jgi:pimeloyl-ACP methyl ester carboxylesterase
MTNEAANGGVKLHYELSGPADGPLVILVAGLGEQIGAVEFPAEHAQRFAQAGYRVARMDNRDAGRSSSLDRAGRPELDPLFTAMFAGESIPVPYSFLDMADDVLAVADATGSHEVHLVGASMGGFIVRWAAARHPDRIRSLTVVMSGAGADFDDDGPQLEAEGLDELIAMADHRDRDEQIAYTVELWRADWGTTFPFDEDWVTAQVTASYERAYRPDGIYRQIIAGFGSPGLWTTQRSISCPTLVMHGTDDSIFPIDHGEATAANVPGAAFWRVQGMGHAMPSELWDEMVDRFVVLSH